MLIGIVETSLMALPGGTSTNTVTVADWFTFYQHNLFMALRNMGLLNMFFSALALPLYIALYTAHRNSKRALGALALTAAFLGSAVFFATNRAFPMLDLSQQYAHATTDAQKVALIAADKVMLSIGQSHTPGTFFAFLFTDLAGTLISIAMLQGKVFSKINAIFCILGFTLLLIFEVLTSFIWSLDTVAYIFVTFGGLLSTV